MLLTSMRLLASSGIARCGRARRFAVVIGMANTVPARNTASVAMTVIRMVFIPTPPRFRESGRISEAEPQAETNRARDAEDCRTLQSELVHGIGIHSFGDQLLRHRLPGLRVEVGVGVGR